MTMRTGLAGYCAWAAPATNSKSSAMVLIRSPHGEHFLAGHRHLGSEDLAVGRIGDVQRLAAKSDVGHQPMLLPPVGEVRRQAVRVEAPDADAEVADDETVFIVHLDAVGTGVTAGELDRDAGLGWRATRHQRQAPDLPAVVRRDKLPLALAVDAEDAAVRDVDAPEVPLAIEGRPFEEAVERGALAVGVGPGGAALPAKLGRQRGQARDLDLLHRLE